MSKNIRDPHGIDLNAPGGLAALFAFHRGTFGDATMSAAPAEGGATPLAPVATPDAPATTPAAATPTAPAAPVAAAAPVAPAVAEKVEDLPAWAQKLITDTRAEAAANRVSAGTKTAAEQQLEALTKILNPDAGGAPVDPAALAQELADRDSELRTLKVDNALGASLVTAGADPLTLAVLRGEGKLNDLDPTAPTFQADIDTVIKDALTRHPKLKAVQAATKSGASFTGRPGEAATKRVGLTDALNSHYGTK